MPNFYETDRAVSEYLFFHYGRADEVLPWPFGPSGALEYPARCVIECLDLTALPQAARALDLGCAVGRSTFELARHCTEVIGIDNSQRFVEFASKLKQEGSLPYAFTVEGGLKLSAVAQVTPEIDRSRVSFEQGDAMSLRADLGEFDVVLMANLIDRLSDPRQCLAQLPGLVRPCGQLIITSPCTWLEEYTPREHWLGGFEQEGRAVRTLDTLKEFLGEDFDFTGTKDLPFLIREHSRKFQWSVAQASIWRRRHG